ncbi:MAG: alpha/beta fold hydrolase, partial [Kordiimonadaceae bacterium]|nr:alpha/beta fold hydrolase [Kordiimonadaceae bacterium]
DTYGEATNVSPLIILHGLFGSASNFRGLAKFYASDYQVHCLDLRNHGASPLSDDMTYSLMAGDVLDFMDNQNIDKAHILGHSMGGKTAMQFSLSYPDRVDKLIIGDIAPVLYPHHHETIFDGLNAIPLDQIKSRGQAEQILKDYVDEAGVRLFLLTNLIRTDEGDFKWRINIPALIKNYDHISAAPEGISYEGETLFIRGENSEYVEDQYVPETLEFFPNAKIETIDDCGHWLHSEKPQEFSKILLDFLK